MKQLFDNKKVFIAYITAGHRSLAFTKQAALGLIAGGVDILEIGVPFSDPIADGPVIQTAMTQALHEHIKMADVLGVIAEIKQETNVPIVLFSYYNPILHQANFYQQAKQANVDAILAVDLPFEESGEFLDNCERFDIQAIGLISPSTPAARIEAINQRYQGFLYYVCRDGITGIRDALPKNYPERMQHIKQHATLPVVAGFGISNASLARQALVYADGFVVGSFFVKAIEKGASAEELTTLARDLDPR